MAGYHLRLFLDAGAGVCLFSQDDMTKARFGYSVELDELVLPRDLLTDLMALMADYDATIDWSDPAGAAGLDGGPVVFGYEEGAPFKDRVRELLPRLRAALGSDFQIESDFEG
jgi:hypothetical protein